MGAALNTAGAAEIAAELACCACSSVCGFLCKDKATRAKLRYITLLLFATITCFVILIPGMRRNIDRIPNFCGKTVTKETCDKFFGFGAVYRVMLSMTCFYGLFAIFTIRVTKSNSFRAKINNGCWIFKMLLILGIMIGSFFVPKMSEFFHIWMYACLIGGFVFMLYQIMLIIDFGHSWSVSWAERLETSNTKLWYLAMILATLLMFAVSMAAIASFYYLFAGSLAITKCKANMFYITFIVIQCFLATIVSVTPTVQRELDGAGLLQSSVVVLYASYLTWNTLSSEPDAVCNPLGKVILDYDTMSGIDGAALFGCLLTFALIIFACTVRAHTSHLGKYGLALSEGEDYAIAIFMSEKKKKSKIDVSKNKNSNDDANEISLDDFVGYNYSLFHVIMTLASLHVLMILTNWHSPDQKSNMKRLVKNWASVWVQMASSFICVLIYVWFLVTPLIRRLWGPIFGVLPDDMGSKGQNSKGKNLRGQNIKGQNTAGINSKGQHYPGQNDKGQSIIGQKTQVKGQNDIVPLLNGKGHNTTELRKRGSDGKEVEEIVGNRKHTAMKRFPSVESLRSVLSTISRKKQAMEKRKAEKMRLLESEISNDSQMTEFSVAESRYQQQHYQQQQQHYHQGQQQQHCQPHQQQQQHSEPQHEQHQKQSRLRRFNSIESLKSGFSAISNATSQMKNKIKTRLKRDRLNKLSEADSRDNETTDLSKRDMSHDLTDISRGSIRSKAGSSRKRTRSGINSGSSDVAKEGGSDVRQDGRHDTSIGKPNHKTQREDRLGERIQNNDKSLTENQNVLQNNEAALSGSSIYPFKRKAQDPEVARQILKLQWKILRMQAKVVKIQEKIIRIQAENEMAKNQERILTERTEPPVGQSSMVAGGVYNYSRRFDTTKGFERKEHG